jgi:uncharacterized protein involved in outer membrane biogenesis
LDPSLSFFFLLSSFLFPLSSFPLASAFSSLFRTKPSTHCRNAMTAAARLPRIGPKMKILLGAVIVLAIVAALFDWNWFRHPLERFLSEKSHREVRIGDLHVELGWSLVPTVRVRNVYVENAPWADKRAFAIAGEASFTFSLKSLWKRRPVISRLVLIDADVDLERQADGLRNWRLRNPDNRAPAKVRVMRLEAQRTRIRFVRRDIDFDMVAASAPLDHPADPPDPALTNKIAFQGEFQGVEFSGEALAGDRLTLLDTGEVFPLRGHIVAGETRFDVDGKVADLYRPSATDAKVRLAGPSLSRVPPLVLPSLPASRRYQVETHLRQTKDEFLFTGLRAKIGGTDLAGDASVSRNSEPPMVKADLSSESMDLADLGLLPGGGHAPASAARSVNEPANRAEPKPGGSGRILPGGPIKLERLNAVDAHVGLNAKKMKAANLPALESLHFSAELKKGILVVKPLHVGLAGGDVTGWLTLDGRKRPASAQVKLDVQGIYLEKLFEALEDAPISPGQVAARLDLQGQGASLATVLGSASGTVALSMKEGRISNLLDARLGLNPAKILRLLIAGDRSIAINSADVTIDFEKGTGTSKNISVDTEQTRVVGTGSISLRDETIDLLLTPHPKKPGLFSMRSSAIHIEGTFKHPQVAVVKIGEKSAMATQ